MRATPAALVFLVVRAAAAQEPIFVTPPVTMYEFGAVIGLDMERTGRVLALSSEAALGLRPAWTVALHGVGVDERGAPLEFARLHLGTRVRLVKVDRPREWLLLSVYGAAALPVGADADLVAEAHGIPDAVIGVSAARMARRGDAFVDFSLAWAPTPTGTRTGGTLGLAWGWRPRPGGYGELEAQLFGEAVGRYMEGGATTIGIAPGVLVHSKNKVVKIGVLFPVWERDLDADVTVKLALKLLL